MDISLKSLGREGQPVISNNGKFLAIGLEEKVDIYDKNFNLVRSYPLEDARPYGNYSVVAVSNDGSKVYLRTWNSFLNSSGGGLFEIDTVRKSIRRVDVDSLGNTFTYQGWSLGENDVDFSEDYSKVVIAIRDTADSVNWGDQRVNIFLKNLASGSVQRIDLKDSTSEMGFSSSPKISSDGGRVVFVSDLSLTSESVSGNNLYLWDSNGSLQLLNKQNDGSIFNSNYGWNPDISGAGNQVVFQTGEALDSLDTNGVSDVYLKNLTNGIITRISGNSSGGIYPRFSNNGQYVFYQVYNQSEKYLKAYSIAENTTIDIPGKERTNNPNFKSESFYDIANDSGIFWTWSDYIPEDTDTDADYYYFSLSKVSPSNYTIDTDSLTFDEPDEGKSQFSIRFSRSGNITKKDHLTWKFIPGTASVGNDYSHYRQEGEIILLPGQRSDGVAFYVNSDKQIEDDETFTFRIEPKNGNTDIKGVSQTIKIRDYKPVSPTYAIISSKSSLEEGGNFTTTISTTGVASGATLYWAISGSNVQKEDFSSGTLSGSGEVDKSGILSFSHSLSKDNLKEGDESFVIKLYADLDRTKLVATSSTVTVTDYSNKAKPTYSISSTPSFVNEGGALGTTVSTTGVASGTTLYWAISGGNVQKEDFSSGTLSGSGTIDKSGSFSFFHSLSKDNLKEDNESFIINLFSDANATTKLASSSIISIRDISTEKGTHTQAPIPTPNPTPISAPKPTPETTSAPVSETLPKPAPTSGFISTPEPTLTGDPPNLLKAIARGHDITLQFDNILSNTKPSSTRFSLFQGSRQHQIVDTEIRSLDGVVKLSFAKEFDPTAKLKLDYLDFPGDQTQGIIESSTGVDLETFNGFTINNQGSRAYQLKIEEGEYEGNQITLFLSAPISKAIPKTSRFKVKSSNKKHRILGVSTEPDEGIIKIKTMKNLDLQESIFVSYRDLGGDQVQGIIEDLAGNDMATIRDFEIASGGNDAVAPIVASAFLDKNILSVEFDSIIQNTSISKNRFKVKVDGKRVRVLSAKVVQDDSYVELKLQPKKLRTIDINSYVTLAYKDPKGDQTNKVVEDVFGNDLDSFNGYGVEIAMI